jgi:hypothetical protein
MFFKVCNFYLVVLNMKCIIFDTVQQPENLQDGLRLLLEQKTCVLNYACGPDLLAFFSISPNLILLNKHPGPKKPQLEKAIMSLT